MIDNSYIDQSAIQAAVNTWGVDAQLDLLQEECAELIVAINHFRRGRVGPEKVAEEIADVFIMCQEGAFIVGEHLVDQQIKDKMKRTADRLVEHFKKALRAQTAFTNELKRIEDDTSGNI
jgi:NTP pyrophosphatase (non-canonical NTP hydrolase)